MSSIEKYTNINADSQEFEDLSAALIQHHLDHQTKQLWAKKLQEEYNIIKPAITHNPLARWKIWLSLFVIALAALSFYYSQSITSPTVQEFTHVQIADLHIFSDPTVFRKGAADIEQLRQSANVAFAEENYQQSIESWQLLIANQKAQPKDYFYLALAHLKNDPSNPAKTLEYLAFLNGTPVFQNEKTWIEALALVKTDQMDQAKMVLEQIIDSDEYKAKEAKELLRILKANR